MNAGAFGGEISNYLRCVDIMDMKGQIISYNPDDLDFAYRFSSFKEDEFIISANFILKNEDSKVIHRNKNNANDVNIFLDELSQEGKQIEYYKRWAIIRNYA